MLQVDDMTLGFYLWPPEVTPGVWEPPPILPSAGLMQMGLPAVTVTCCSAMGSAPVATGNGRASGFIAGALATAAGARWEAGVAPATAVGMGDGLAAATLPGGAADTAASAAARPDREAAAAAAGATTEAAGAPSTTAAAAAAVERVVLTLRLPDSAGLYSDTTITRPTATAATTLPGAAGQREPKKKRRLSQIPADATAPAATAESALLPKPAKKRAKLSVGMAADAQQQQQEEEATGKKVKGWFSHGFQLQLGVYCYPLAREVQQTYDFYVPGRFMRACFPGIEAGTWLGLQILVPVEAMGLATAALPGRAEGWKGRWVPNGPVGAAAYGGGLPRGWEGGVVEATAGAAAGNVGEGGVKVGAIENVLSGVAEVTRMVAAGIEPAQPSAATTAPAGGWGRGGAAVAMAVTAVADGKLPNSLPPPAAAGGWEAGAAAVEKTAAATGASEISLVPLPPAAAAAGGWETQAAAVAKTAAAGASGILLDPLPPAAAQTAAAAGGPSEIPKTSSNPTVQGIEMQVVNEVQVKYDTKGQGRSQVFWMLRRLQGCLSPFIGWRVIFLTRVSDELF